MTRRLAPLLTVFALAGCGFYTGTETASQPNGIGVLRFAVTFCTISATPGTGGATTAPDGTITEPGDPCNQSQSLDTEKRGQGLVALRLPAGAVAPETLVSSDGVTAVKSPSYTSTFTPPAGTQIQGYITPPQTISAKQDYTATFDVALPAPAAGQPFVGPFKARVLSGWRKLATSEDGSAPVACGGDTTCVTSSQPDADLSFETRDLAIGTPAAGSLDFPLRFSGAAGPTFTLSAKTTVPAAAAVPAHESFTPAGNPPETLERVAVTVPTGTDPGTYDVTLTAKLGSETRSATGKITVAPLTSPVGTPTPKPTVPATPAPRPTVVTVATPAPTPAAVPKHAPKSFTLTLKRTGARAFKARGRLKLPAGVVRADGCAGIVRLTVGKVRKSTIVTGSCTFSRTLKVEKAGSYKVTARFTGNQVLTARGATGRRFRAS